MTEAFLMSIGEEADQYALTVAVNKINEWYLSDGWYSDGPEMALDYYNSYVIHPMYIEVLETCKACGFWTPVTPQLAVRRMQRFNVFLERLISPEGTYPLSDAPWSTAWEPSRPWPWPPGNTDSPKESATDRCATR